jgi:3D-(3,5/4)-trihydroxycyclohexane-1,2-dione acylhydrolase (decyclizing)
MSTVRLTMAQALVRYLTSQFTEIDGEELPLFAGVFAIFGHGNVAGMGEALWHERERLPTLRAHNEQAMAHATIAYAKANDRRRLMACTTSIGPGATNLVTAAALAHVNRLPVLLLPGDTFANRAPDPVLQQVEQFGDPSVTANDCFRPVSRYWDRIIRPEQLLRSLPAALATLLDPADCGPVTLALPQDVQAEAYDYPAHFFRRRVHRIRRPQPDTVELEDALRVLREAERPLIVAGGGVHYSGARQQLGEFAERHRIPVAETQAGKGALTATHPCQVGAVGVTGTEAANRLAADADVVLAVGTRLADFPTASRSVFRNPRMTLIGLNVQRFDAAKHDGLPLVADARVALAQLDDSLADWAAPESWFEAGQQYWHDWNAVVDRVTAASDAALPTDAQVLGAVNRFSRDDGVVVCAAGGLPGELHKLWRVKSPGGYHLEYGYSCMGYEIAGGLGVKLAQPEREVFVLVGDGSYLMLNSEIATSVMLERKLIVVVLDNRGYGCINRLQQACGGAPFNNLLRDAAHGAHGIPDVDFAAHARALGAAAEKVTGIAALEDALQRARASDRTYVVVLDTDPIPATAEGGAWWDVPVPEHSERREVQEARRDYDTARARRHQ